MSRRNKSEIESFLSAATPPDLVYEAYLVRAETFLQISKSIRGLPFDRLRLIKSQLFQRRYLVANFNRYTPAVLQELSACAHVGINIFEGVITPPIVLTAPASSSSKQAYRSILEHEFVHINQMLLKKFPVALDSEPGGPLRYLGELTSLEYEAYFLQLSRWSELYEDESNQGMNLDQWCTFRAYTSSLECLLMLILGGKIRSALVRDFLENGPPLLGDVFSKLGLDKDTGLAYGLMFPQHIQSALFNCTSSGLKTVPKFHRLMTDWVKGQRDRIGMLERLSNLPNV